MDDKHLQDLSPARDCLFCRIFTKRWPHFISISAAFFLLVMMSWIGYATSGQYLGMVDQQAQAIAKKTVEQTAAAFLIAKSINGALSVASTFTVGAGAIVNGSIEPGKVLDPFDRLIDDFSGYLLIAATAAALTELLLIIDGSVGFIIVIPVCVGLILLIFLLKKREWSFHLRNFFKTLLALILLLRLGLPFTLIGSHQGYEWFLAPSYEQAKMRLNDIQTKTQLMYDSIVVGRDHSDQWFMSRWIDNASDKMEGVQAATKVLKDNFDHFFDAIFTMTAVMALEIMILPILLGWILWRLIRRLIGERQVIIR